MNGSDFSNGFGTVNSLISRRSIRHPGLNYKSVWVLCAFVRMTTFASLLRYLANETHEDGESQMKTIILSALGKGCDDEDVRGYVTFWFLFECC